MPRRSKADPTLTGPQRLARASAGTVIEPATFKGSSGDARAPLEIEPIGDDGIVRVQTSCKDGPAGQYDKHGGHWICLTHSRRFDNQFQKDTHIHQGTHVLAWYCAACGQVEEP